MPVRYDEVRPGAAVITLDNGVETSGVLLIDGHLSAPRNPEHDLVSLQDLAIAGRWLAHRGMSVEAASGDSNHGVFST